MTSRGQFIQLPPDNSEVIPEMSVAVWCDKGGHAFSSKDEERQHFTQTQTVNVPTGNSYGNPTYQERKQVTEEIDICGPCWKSSNPFSAPAPTAIENAEVKAAKAEADMWRSKYEANKVYGPPPFEQLP